MLTTDRLAALAAAFERTPANDFPLPPHLAFLGVTGSVCQNTDLPEGTPDLDLRGMVVPPARRVWGLEGWTGWGPQQPVLGPGGEELDVHLHSLGHLVALLLKGDPTVLEWLWLRPEHVWLRSPAYEALVANRQLFVARSALAKFLGMARGQLKRMHPGGDLKHRELHQWTQTHERLERWGVDPEAVVRGEVQPRLVSGLGAACDADLGGALTRELGEYRRICREMETPAAETHQIVTGRLGAKRKEIVDAHGWNPKQGMHAIRVLRMGAEMLETGELRVWRDDDADELRDIKRGRWTLDQVQGEADRLMALITERLATTRLPDEPDRAGAERLLEDLYRSAFDLGPVRPPRREGRAR